MSFAIDANILVYAADRGSAQFAAARRFVESCIIGPEIVHLAWPTVSAFLRISTLASASRAPLTQEEAEDAIGQLLALPHVRLISEQDGFWSVYREVTREVRVRGNMVTDAHLAALLRQNGVKTLYTRDRDFRRFDFLEVRDPFGT